jgi:hypothetical protein
MDEQEWARQELRRRIDSSGLGITKFARNTLIRDPSTVHRWLNGSPISEVVCTWLLGNWRLLENSQSEQDTND